MSTGQSAMMVCGWGVKEGSLVSRCQPERFRDEYRTHYKVLCKCPVSGSGHGRYGLFTVTWVQACKARHWIMSCDTISTNRIRAWCDNNVLCSEKKQKQIAFSVTGYIINQRFLKVKVRIITLINCIKLKRELFQETQTVPIGPPKSSTQRASGLVQPSCRAGSLVRQTDRLTRPTDHATRSATIGHNYVRT